MIPQAFLIILFMALSSCASALPEQEPVDNVILICTCGTPAVVIKEGRVIPYDHDGYDAHINQLVKMACTERTGLPTVDVYYTEDATGKKCPIDI